MRGRHQLQLNRNMTKVNAPRAGGGRQGHKGSRLYVRVPINGARRSRCSGQLPPAEEPSSLFAHSIGLASGVRATDAGPPRPLCTTSHAPGMRDCHVRCPSDALRAESVRTANLARRAGEAERERERGEGFPSDCKRQPRPRVIATRAVTFRIKPER